MPGIKTFITEDEALKMFDDMIDEGGPVTVMGINFTPSRVLTDLDPIAYREGFNQYVDSLMDSGYEVEGF